MKCYIRKHWVEFGIVSVISVLFALIYVGVSIVLQEAIDYVIAGKIFKAIVISGIFLVSFLTIYMLQIWGQVEVNQKIMKELREEIIKRIIKKSNQEFTKYKETDYISLMQNDVKKIEENYIEILFSIIVYAAQLICAIAVMTRYSPYFTLVMLVMTVGMFCIPGLFSKKITDATEMASSGQQGLTEGISEAIYGYEIVKSFQKEQYAISKFNLVNSAMKRHAAKLERVKKMNSGVSQVLGFFMQMVICLMAAWYIYKGKLSYGSMVGVIQVSGSITNPLFQMFALVPVLQSFAPIWQKIDCFTEIERDYVGMNNKKSENILWKQLTFKNVKFAYNESERVIFKDISLSIEKGKKYLVVGESGSGKSTLIKLLCGKLVPTTGEIVLDGRHDGETELILQKLTSGVWQNTFLFNESIKDNIVMGEEKEEVLDNAVSAASLEDVILEKGADFTVGANGANLSGGQKQRVAIARALAAQKDVLILDEGVSALDEKMGQDIEKRLLAKADLTLVSISHHVIPEVRELYDVVLEVKNGQILVS